MSLIGTYFLPEETRDYAVKEGNITVSSGINCVTGKRDKFLNFANEIVEETFLEFSGTVDSEYGMICMQKASAGGYATHINEYEPEFEVGFIPTSNATDGNYSRRHVGCSELRAGREYRLPCSATNSAISVNDCLELTSATGGLDKSASTTTVIALEAKSANEGGYIFVRLGEPKIPVASP